MKSLAEIFVPITFFALVFLIVYFTSKFNYEIKKTILEKGGNIEITKKKFPFLEIGLTVLGVGIGLAVSVIPQSSNLPEDSKNLLVGASILIFGGLGLVSAFYIRKRIEKQ
jgi:hypothetical protein